MDIDEMLSVLWNWLFLLVFLSIILGSDYKYNMYVFLFIGINKLYTVIKGHK